MVILVECLILDPALFHAYANSLYLSFLLYTLRYSMKPEKDLSLLLKQMSPELHEGAYVFVTLPQVDHIPRKDIVCEFKEKEGITLVLEKEVADQHALTYEFIASWITLTVHSSLEAVGLTAAFLACLSRTQYQL